MKTLHLIGIGWFLAGGGAFGFRLQAEPTGMAAKLIERLKMQRIPLEGPWFSVTHVTDDQIAGTALSPRYRGKAHPAGSAIYHLLTREDFSALHKLRTDETWHFYAGDPLELLLLHPDGRGEMVVLGPDIFAGHKMQFTVRQGVWMGAAPTDAATEGYTLGGNTLAPGFDYDDFEMGYRDELQKAFPKFEAQIARLTRAEFASRAASLEPAVAVAGATIFSLGDLKPIEIAPGMHLRELVGRQARAKTERYSVASFTLDQGCSTLFSYNKVSEETILITRGRGQAILGEQIQSIGPGSVIVIPPGVKHAVRADAHETIDFLAIEAPAFEPGDFVVEPMREQARP